MPEPMVIVHLEFANNVLPPVSNVIIPDPPALAVNDVEPQPLRVVTVGELMVNPGITIVMVSPASSAALSVNTKDIDDDAAVTGFATVSSDWMSAGVTAVISVDDGIVVVVISVAEAKLIAAVLLVASAA
jgi:hypothetical protein